MEEPQQSTSILQEEAAHVITRKQEADKDDNNKTTIEMYQRALDDLFNMNSLFSVAVFIGISFSTSDRSSLDGRKECDASLTLLRVLIFFEILSFSMFLCSSLMTKTLKLELSVQPEKIFEHGYLKSYGQSMMYFSVWGSFLACLFLIISIICVIQVKLGKASCGNAFTIPGILYMCSVFSPAMLAYLRYATLASSKFSEPSANPRQKSLFVFKIAERFGIPM